MRTLFLALTAAALFGTTALAGPREDVGGIAAVIEGQYFDPAKGKEIADGLRAAAAKGEFDALTDQRDLAQTLTRRLQPLDHHFGVVWPVDAPPGPPPGAQGSGPGPRQEDPFERRGNYGFMQVSVLPGNVGYIDMRFFAEIDFKDPGSPARVAADAALQLVANTDAVIIDLRDNGGGAPSMVGYVTSAFTPKGADIYNTFHYRQGTESEAPAVFHPKPRLDVPLYVLTSARTGSAAEALAYTLKNAGRAVVIGEATAGAANPGDRFPAGNRYAIFVSTGAPMSPITHTNWEGAGVQPAVAVPSTKALEAARMLALEAAAKHGLTGDVKTDNQWALESLRAETSPPLAIKAGDYAGQYSGATVAAAGDTLTYQRGRRPASILVALGGDVFTMRGDHSRRLTFQRDAAGKVTAIEFSAPDGGGQRLRRDP